VVLTTPPDPLGAGGGLRRRIPAMGVIDDYLEDLGDSQRAELERIRRIVLDRVPDAEEGRSYGMPAFRYKRKPLLGFAALKDHLSLFPFSPHVVAAVKGRLAGYDLSKGTIRFTEAKPIPEDVISEILDLRLEEIGQLRSEPAARDRQAPACRTDRPRQLAISSSYCPLPALRPSWPSGGSCRPG
jgi:uncharacterized protein YdhG (YjbR/CyaY superfamily)